VARARAHPDTLFMVPLGSSSWIDDFCTVISTLGAISRLT
jgi:hypothetical protein